MNQRLVFCVSCEGQYLRAYRLRGARCPSCGCKHWSYRSRVEVEKLFEQWTPLAYRVLRVRGDPDLESVALQGLLEAARWWDPSRSKFVTFAWMRIRHRLGEATKAARADAIRKPWQFLVYGDDNKDAAANVVDEKASEPVDCLSGNERLDLLRQALERASPRHRLVLELRFRDGCTLADIGARIGVSKESARVIELEAISRLRKKLVGVGLDS